MPPIPPPPRPPGEPLVWTVPSGFSLWRLHSREHEPNEFNPNTKKPPGGGRFDAPAREYAHLYAGKDLQAAVAETLLRQLLRENPPILQLPFKAVEEKDVSTLTTSRELAVVDIRGGDGLTPLGQDAWLTTCPPSDYGLTRQWAVAIRGWVRRARGLVWHPRNDPDRVVFVFFSDRASPSDFRLQERRPADGGQGFEDIRHALRKYQVVIRKP